MVMFEFSEPQGRLVITLDCYLNQDLNNEELETLFNSISIDIKDDSKLISDIDFIPITE